MKTHVYLASLLALSSLVGCSKVEPAAAPPASTTAPAATSGPVAVSSWGPQITTPGVAVNPLPSGAAGMYFVLSRPMDGVAVEVLFDGTPLSGVAVDGKTITAELPATQFAALGKHSVGLKLGSGQTIEVGDFVVAATLPKVPGDTGAANEKSAPDATAAQPAQPAKNDEPPAK